MCLHRKYRNLAGAVGVALSATLLDSRETLHQVQCAERQLLYPTGAEQATSTIRELLIQDRQVGEILNQMTGAVLRQQLAERAAMASYHDLFAMFAILAMACLIPVLLLRTGQCKIPSVEKTPAAPVAEKLAKPAPLIFSRPLRS